MIPRENQAKPEPIVAPVALPRYVSRERNRHGTTVYYFRRNSRRIRLHESPGTAAFLDEIAFVARRTLKPDERQTGPVVYFLIYGNSRIKIGTSKNLKKRVGGIRTGVPGRAHVHYVIPGDKSLERALHRKFIQDRLNGEWFVFSKQIKAWIEEDRKRSWAESRVNPKAARALRQRPRIT